MNNGISWIKVIIWFLIFCFVGAFWFFIALEIKGCNDKPVSNTTIFVHDTALVTKYETSVQRDTVVKLLKKIIYKQVKPDTVYWIKTDSVFIEKAKKLDLMLSVDKRADKLGIYVININDTLLKRIIFSNVGHNFTATAQDGGVFVKSQKFYWNRFKLSGKYHLPFKKLLGEHISEWKEGDAYMELTTGINYMDRLHLDIGPGYDFTGRGAYLKTELGIIF